jgi:NAD-dependent SIR2 family protein deacetylase
MKLYVFVNALFANNKNLSSQIGYVIVLSNKTKINDKTVSLHGNILHWSSTKCKRVTRSLLASELYLIVTRFDIGAVL